MRGQRFQGNQSQQPQRQDHGIINQSQWILIEPEHQGGTGEDGEEVHREGT